jgi:peptidoglycan/LPS O-acetylase OafA/YrhL
MCVTKSAKKALHKQNGERIPTLDGWRGVAILMVVFDHWQAGFFYGRRFHNWPWLITGWHGVAIFFVLSGYLITTRLFDEDSLQHFYIRRIFRLWPIAWLYLAILGLCRLIHWDEIIPCVLFYRNFVFLSGSEKALTAHFWSLSVEEQFYLVWPAVLAFGRRGALWFALIGIAAFVCFGPTWPYVALLVGCATAFAVRNVRVRDWIRAQHAWLLPVCLVGFAGCIARYQYGKPLIESIFIAIMLACTSLTPSWASRALEQKSLRDLGVYSYSVYIWQEILLLTHTGLLGIMLLPVAAIASYYLIERPCIRIGARLTQKNRMRGTRSTSADTLAAI